MNEIVDSSSLIVHEIPTHTIMDKLEEKVIQAAEKAAPPIKKVMFFSMVTGEIYEVESDEVNNLDRYQIPLCGRPGSCKKCYGRMHMGKNITVGVYMLCTHCAKKYVDFSLIKNDVINVETVKHAN